MTQHKQSHRIKWHDHHIKWHDMTCHVATNHSSSPHVTSQPSTLLHLTPQATSWHQNRSHHHHGTAEGSFTAKKWFGHRAGRSPCAHSIGKFFLCYIVLFLLETSAPGLSGHYWYRYICIYMFCLSNFPYPYKGHLFVSASCLLTKKSTKSAEVVLLSCALWCPILLSKQNQGVMGKSPFPKGHQTFEFSLL